MLKLIDLKGVLEAKGIKNKVAWLEQQGFPRKTSYNLMTRKMATVRFSHLERLCEIFNCQVQDLFEWKPGSDADPEKHPLAGLMRENFDLGGQRKIRKLSLAQLQKLKEFVDEL